MTNVLILHGTKGKPDSNWFPWLIEKCNEHNIPVSCPQLPTPENQTLENWFKAIKNETIDENTTIIGHSCGGSFLTHILAKHQIKKAIFVASVMNMIDIPEYDDLNKSFVDFSNIDWRTVTNNANITIYHGDNDPYVPLDQARLLRDKTRSPLHVIPNGGHLNSESGYIEFHQVWDEIQL